MLVPVESKKSSPRSHRLLAAVLLQIALLEHGKHCGRVVRFNGCDELLRVLRRGTCGLVLKAS